METLEKPRVTDVSSTSGDTSNWAYPVTKRQAIDFQDDGVQVSLSKSLAGNLVNFLQSIGADNELPDDHRSQVEWLNHFHKQLAVNNPLWPEDMSFEFVYAQFVNAVMYKRVDLRGHNVHAFITAFRDWITQSGIEHTLREKWHQSHPEEAPKQLDTGIPGESLDDIEENRLIQGQQIEQWPDEVLFKQYHTIRVIVGEGKDGLLEPFNLKGQMSRVIREAQKRGLV